VAREPDVPPSTAHPTPSAATSGRLSALADPRARLADGPVSPRGARPASLLLGSPAHCWRRPRALGPPPRRRSQPVCDKRPGRPRALIGCAHTPCARSPTSVTGPASSCSSSRRRSPCCCLRPCAHAAHRHTPNRNIETLRGGVDPVSRTSDGLRRPAAKGSCLSCREPVPPLRRSSVVRRSSRPSPYLWRCLGYQECPSVQEFLADDEPAPVRTPDPRSRVARWLLRAVGHWDFVWDFVRIRGAEPLASDD
jgi:hypothetical protein